MTSIAKADLDKARDILFDARNLVDAIRRIAENMKDTEDDLDFVIQTVARIAMGKIDDVTGGVLDPPATEKEIAGARILFEKSGGYRKPDADSEQAKPENEPA
jgi:hypothetical protein